MHDYRLEELPYDLLSLSVLPNDCANLCEETAAETGGSYSYSFYEELLSF
jgi:hypothetical protein